MSPEDQTQQKIELGTGKVLVREGLFHLPTSPHEEPYLIGSKCSACSHVAFPQRAVCPACLRDDTMEQIPLSRKGRIHSFTLARMAPPGFTAPYLQAYVDLPEGPCIFSLITGCEPAETSLRIGMEVELVIESIGKDEQGNDVIGYKFRPVPR